MRCWSKQPSQDHRVAKSNDHKSDNEKGILQVCTHEFPINFTIKITDQNYIVAVVLSIQEYINGVGYNRVEPGLRDSSTKTDDPDDY